MKPHYLVPQLYWHNPNKCDALQISMKPYQVVKLTDCDVTQREQEARENDLIVDILRVLK